MVWSYAKEIEQPEQQGTVHYRQETAGHVSYPRPRQRDHRTFVEDQLYPRSLRPLVNPFGTGLYYDQRGRIGYQFMPDFTHYNRATNANRTFVAAPRMLTTPPSIPQ